MDDTFNSMLNDYGRHRADYGRMIERHRELLYQARLVRMFPSAQRDTRRKHAFNLRMAADTRKIANMYLIMAKREKSALELYAASKLDFANGYYGHDYAVA